MKSKDTNLISSISAEKVTLKKDKVYFCIFILFLFACKEPRKAKNNNSYLNVSVKSIGKLEYKILYKTAEDTIRNWISNEVFGDSVMENNVCHFSKYKLDSLICVNSNKNKMIGALFNNHYCSDKSKLLTNDGIHFLFGEKFEGKWYFWVGAYIIIPKTIFPKHDSKLPLSYKQLHQQAIKEIFDGYLKENGEINEKWFTFYFYEDGWFKFEDRYKYKYILDGKKIDTKNKYYEYIHKKKAFYIWAHKSHGTIGS